MKLPDISVLLLANLDRHYKNITYGAYVRLSLVGCVLNDIFMSPQINFSLKYLLVADVFAEKVGKKSHSE